MLIDQQEMNALMSQGGETAAATKKRVPTADTMPEARRIRRIRVPVIAQLAATSLPISEIRRLSCGSIIKFEKSVDDELELMINNRVIGTGVAVKIGEKFGLQVNRIGDTAQRILSLGQ